MLCTNNLGKRCNIDLDTIKGIILRFKVDFMDAFSKSFIHCNFLIIDAKYTNVYICKKGISHRI